MVCSQESHWLLLGRTNSHIHPRKGPNRRPKYSCTSVQSGKSVWLYSESTGEGLQSMWTPSRYFTTKPHAVMEMVWWKLHNGAHIRIP